MSPTATAITSTIKKHIKKRVLTRHRRSNASILKWIRAEDMAQVEALPLAVCPKRIVQLTLSF